MSAAIPVTPADQMSRSQTSAATPMQQTGDVANAWALRVWPGMELFQQGFDYRLDACQRSVLTRQVALFGSLVSDARALPNSPTRVSGRSPAGRRFLREGAADGIGHYRDHRRRHDGQRHCPGLRGSGA